MTDPAPLFGPAARDRMVAQARKIITDPRTCADRPSLRLFAWAVLKSAQGKPLRQRRMK